MENNNDLIAQFMGYEKVTIGYIDGVSETQWQRENQDWLDKVGLDYIGDYYVNMSENKYFNVCGNDLWYGEWNNLMTVVEKIDSMGQYEVSIIYNECSIGENIDAEHYRGLVDIQGKTKLEAVYLAVVEFIEKYNEK